MDLPLFLLSVPGGQGYRDSEIDSEEEQASSSAGELEAEEERALQKWAQSVEWALCKGIHQDYLLAWGHVVPEHGRVLWHLLHHALLLQGQFSPPLSLSSLGHWTDLSLFSKAMHDNEYLAAFISSCSEVPGILAASWLVDALGRKWTLILFYLICGVATVILSLGQEFLPFAALVVAAVFSRGEFALSLSLS